MIYIYHIESLSMKKWFHSRFDFSKREINGMLALLIILVLVSAFPYGYEWYIQKISPLSAGDSLAIQELKLVDRYQKRFSKPDVQNEIEESSKKHDASYFKFDPNTTSAIDWQKMGFSAKQAAVLLNYTQKGGHFYRAEDLKKMFVVSNKKYQELLPYINIVPKKNAFENKPAFTKQAAQIIEINGADTIMLDKIKGIGAAFARRIVKYRERLGGFHQKEQLMEVFGLDSAKYKEIKDQISLDGEKIRKIKINTVVFDDLKTHPYLKYKEMNAIVQYRKQHGNYQNIDDLRKILILSPQSIERIAPYLNFEP
jgi:competence ComEA-like helix-hairpin-helix protein